MDLIFPDFDSNEIDNLKECLDSGWVTQGPFVEKFEKQVAEKQKVNHALATTSCTAALHLATLALDFKKGDEVIVPSFTWITSANCVEYVGAKAVFVDVNIDSFNLDVEQIENAINENTRGIVAVHLFGLAADMDAINSIASKYNLAVIEDAACAIGTTYKERPIGGIGDAGCFSFHPRKVVTTGEGGMVTTNNDNLAEVLASLRNHGSTGVPETGVPRGPWTMASFNRLGYNLRMSDIQAAVGVAQMDKLDKILEVRRKNALQYSSILADIDEIIRPTDNIDCSGHSYQSYVVRLSKGGYDERNRIMSVLQEQGINTRPGTHTVPSLGYYRDKYHYPESAYKNALLCEQTTITLPLFPGITEDDMLHVKKNLKKAIAN